jgi:hypothetical protein
VKAPVGFTLHHTPTMPWAPMGGIVGFKTRVLRVDPVTRATVELQFAPPEFSKEVRDRLAEGAVRHYHRTVTERHYFLSGDLPNCDWRDLTDPAGEVTVYRRHSFLDRPPMTLHGLLPGHLTEAGSEYLVWNTGPGTALWDPAAATETVELPVDAGPEYAAAFVRPRILQIDRLPWTPHPRTATWFHKRIAVAVPGSPAVDVVCVPPDSVRERVVAEGNGGPERWMFLLSGSLDVEVTHGRGTERLELHEGSFLDLEPGTSFAIVAGEATSQGATVLCVGHDLASSHEAVAFDP